jgi:CD36 family
MDVANCTCFAQTKAIPAEVLSRHIAELHVGLSCSAIDRCAYPEVYNGTWNMSLTYQTPTLLTRARFYGADPAVAATTGNTFSANYDDHSWNYDVEHISGLTIRVSYRLCTKLLCDVDDLMGQRCSACHFLMACNASGHIQSTLHAGAPHLPDQSPDLSHRCSVPQCLDEGARQVRLCAS